MDFQDYGYVCHLNKNMILPKLSDDEVKQLDVPESCKCTTCVRERSHMTSAAEGGGGFKMLTVADKGGGGLSLADVSKNT